MGRTDHWYPLGSMEGLEPVKVTDVTLAFPANISHLLPPAHEIPDEFVENTDTKHGKFVSQWFFGGIGEASFTPKSGIDPELAWRHIRAIMGSFEPKHEYKMAATAYLVSLWFEDDFTYSAPAK